MNPGSDDDRDTGALAPALDVRGLAKRFGAVRAVRDVGFALGAGETLAVFGPNGAGKTTLLRMLAGLTRPDAGEVRALGRLLGRPSGQGGGEARRGIGLISHASMLYDGLTALENLEFAARIYSLDRPRERALRALEAAGLAARAASLAGTMSRGMTQRLAIARALLHDPTLLLLDEPFTGLDQAAAGALREQLARLRDARRTIVLVTHNLDEGLELASHVAIQVAGRFVEFGAHAGGHAEVRRRYAEAAQGG